MRRRAAALVAVLLGASASASGAASAATAWPDSVLARVGPREITVREATDAWRAARPIVPADSITPAGAARFLDLLVAQSALTQAAVGARVAWAPEDSLGQRGLQDRLAMSLAVEAELARSRADARDDSADVLVLGVRARDRIVAASAVTFDDSAAARLARAFAGLPRPTADSGLAAQVRMLSTTPRLTAAERGATIARSRRSAIAAGAIVDAWSRLSVAVRPRIDTAEQVEDLARNLVFEDSLRAAARAGGLERDPRVTAALAANAERLALHAYLEHTILEGLRPDARALHTAYDRDPRRFDVPLRVRGVRLELGDRAAAERMRVTLGDPAAAESLAARARRRGIEYRFETDSLTDPVLFRLAAAAGPGAAFGPSAVGDAWWIGRVDAIVPGRPRSFDEVRDLLAQEWTATEAERRTERLALDLERRLRSRRAPGAEQRLASALAASSSASPAGASGAGAQAGRP